MPFIRIMVPDGILDEQQRCAIAEQMTVEVMKAETGGKDTPSFRAISALAFDVVKPSEWFIGGKMCEGAAAIVEIRVPAGAVDDDKRRAMVEASYRVLTANCAALAAVDGVRRIWTHIFEVVDWGAGGTVVTLESLAMIAGDLGATLTAPAA